MYSRERVLKVLNHMLPDRVPMYEVLIDSPMVEQVLGIQGKSSWDLPADELVLLHKKLGLDAVMQPLVFWRPVELKNTQLDVRKLVKPSGKVVDECIKHLQSVTKCAHEEGLAVAAYNHGCFDVAYESLGFENYMTLLYDDFDYVDEVTGHLYEFHRSVTEIALQTDIDFFQIGDDICFKSGLFIKPDMFFKLWYEREKDQVAMIKKTKRPVEYHTDGALEPVLQYLIDIGVDIVNPVEPYSNDIFDLKEKFGDKIALRGNVDIAGPLAFGTPEEVYEEAKNLVIKLKHGGNFVCSSSHSISPGVKKLKNYAAISKAVNEYGWYND